jgi:uncharacterized coiled-coil protein SlyX
MARESFVLTRARSPMMKAVLKTLALSFGGGLALGAGIRLTQGAAKSRREPGVDLDPLLSRLKNVESRISEMESDASVHVESPVSAAPLPSEVLGQSLVAFEARLASQLNDVEQIRGDIRRVDERLADLDSQLPVLVQSSVEVRFQEVERKLQHEFEEAQSRSMAAFVDTLQSKVVDRISTLETNLAEQSQAIGKLRDASQRSDENLQKMLVGIERLVDQTKAPPPAPPPVAVAPPPPPLAIPRESPASVYEAASAIVRKEPAEPHDGARPRAVKVTEPPAAAGTPLFEVPEDVPVQALAPEIPPADTEEMVYIKVSADEIEAPTPAQASAIVEPAAEVPEVASAVATELPPPEPLKAEESYEWVNKIGLELLAPRPKRRIGWRIPLVIGLAAGIILIVGLIYSGMLQHFLQSGSMPQVSTLASTSPAPSEPPAPAQTAKQPGDASVQLQVAREYQRRKDWTRAESSYRVILEAEPNNRDAALGLSDVLYQEQKYEESAAVMNKLQSAKSQ